MKPQANSLRQNSAVPSTRQLTEIQAVNLARIRNLVAWFCMLTVPLSTAVFVLSDSVQMGLVWFLVFLAAALLSILVVQTSKYHMRVSADHQTDGVQKMHSIPVPRIGGLAIFPVCLLGAYLIPHGLIGHMETEPTMAGLVGMKASLKSSYFYFLLCLSGLPVFAAGLVEDLTKSIRETLKN